MGLDLFRSSCKINEHIRIVFLTCKLFNNGGLAYPSGTFDQKCSLAVTLLLPLEHTVINLSLENSYIGHIICYVLMQY